jgi:dTDP-4-amino-4,6-dideoxygalactose transaminase
MNIPMLDLKAQYQSIKAEIDQKILEIVASQRFILGPEVDELEKEISAYIGVKHGIGVSSGTDALLAAFMALGVGRGDAVVTTPFTFFATVGTISRLGATAVFCDIEPQSFNMDPLKLADVLENECRKQKKSRIKAIIPIHLYGQCADMSPILRLADDYRLPLVEDGAQAIGAEYPLASGVKKANGMGDMGIISFYPSKNLGAFGDAGMVLTDREDMAEKLRLLRVHGARKTYYHRLVGGNFRMDAIQAGVLRVKLKHLDEWLAKRREKASNYDRLFKDSGLIEDECVKIPDPLYKKSGVKNYHTYHQYVIRSKNRHKLQNFLRTKGIAAVTYYPLALHLQECFASLGYKKGDFPESEKATAEVLALPIYPELAADKQECIVAVIEEFYRGKG